MIQILETTGIVLALVILFPVVFILFLKWIDFLCSRIFR